MSSTSNEDIKPDVDLTSVESKLPPYSDIPNSDSQDYDDEKQPFLVDDQKLVTEDAVDHKVKRHSDKFKRFCQILSLFGVIYLVNFVYINFNEFNHGLSNFKFGFNCGSSRVPVKPLDHHPLFRNLIDIVDTSSEEEQVSESSKPKEVISVTNPFVPNPHFGKSLYSKKLFRHDFGNSWGKPAILNFTAPADLDFDAVVLSLHTKVDGVQFDRLANLFVDGVQVWRTSTIEPGGRKTFSYFKKDVSKYSKLFKKENAQILFQLDNLLTDKLTGVFDVTLSVDLYKFHKFPPHHEGSHHEDHHPKKEGSHSNEHEEEVEKKKRDSDSDEEKDNHKQHKNKDRKHHKQHQDKDDKHHEEHHDKDSKHHKEPKKPEHPPHHPPHNKPEHPPHDGPHHPPHRLHKEHEIFSSARPADKIYPLTFSSNPNQAPVVYLSRGRLAIDLPKVAKNTTRLQLSIFTSGNAADEFWYSNVLDKFKDVFADDGNQFLGRGPARAVNVYFNGKKIVTQTPEPVIFTGGISPALWSPVVSFNAFDVPSIDVDVTGLLPYLWEHQALDEKVLEIEISNGIGEIEKDESVSVNENWITTANLLTFENSQVVESSGEVVNSESTATGNVIGIPPHFTPSFQQIVEVILKTQLISNISLKLKNGKVLNTTLSTYWQAEIANVQNYGKAGDRQSVVHVGHSTQSFLIQDNDLPESDEQAHGKHKKPIPHNAIVSSNTSLSYPLVLNLNQFSKNIFSGDDFFVDYEVKLVHSKGVHISFSRDHGSIDTFASQNGKSRFFISSKGNHGVGATTSKYESKFKFGRHERAYRRVVDAVNGTIVSDKTDTHREDDAEKHRFASVVQVLENASNNENAFELSNKILKALHGSTKKTPCHGMRGRVGGVIHHGGH